MPDARLREAAVDWFASIAPEADEIEIKAGEEVEMEWWSDRLEEDVVDDGFQLKAYSLPCCGTISTLNDLQYNWPQGFARFGLEAMNPNIGMLSDVQVRECEKILQTPLRVIYQHL